MHNFDWSLLAPVAILLLWLPILIINAIICASGHLLIGLIFGIVITLPTLNLLFNHFV